MTFGVTQYSFTEVRNIEVNAVRTAVLSKTFNTTLLIIRLSLECFGCSSHLFICHLSVIQYQRLNRRTGLLLIRYERFSLGIGGGHL